MNYNALSDRELSKLAGINVKDAAQVWPILERLDIEINKNELDGNWYATKPAVIGGVKRVFLGWDVSSLRAITICHLKLKDANDNERA